MSHVLIKMPQNLRNLSDDEIRQLKSQGCTAENWQTVRVAEPFLTERVVQVDFAGEVSIGVLEGSITRSSTSGKPCGIYRARIQNCTIGDNGRIANVGGHLAAYHVGNRVLIENIGVMETRPGARFGNGVEVVALNEAGGREVPLFDALSSQFAYLVCVHRYRPEVVRRLLEMAKTAASSVAKDFGAVSDGASITGVPKIVDVNVGAYATIDSALSLVNGTVLSHSDAVTMIGDGVIAKDFIVAEGAQIGGSAIIRSSFVGQGSRVGNQFSAENTLFFANCEAFHGEACSVFAGPYTVTHHKSTLLIGGMFSFYNAGSGTNQSNHRYKLGPTHEGKLERGSKTGSFAYMMWPCRVGPFSVVLGKHTRSFNTADLPFSYLEADSSGRCEAIPGHYIATVGTLRDGAKWPKRDRRSGPVLRDVLCFDVFSPLTVGRMIRGAELLSQLQESTDRKVASVNVGGAEIKRVLLRMGAKRYTAAVERYLLEQLFNRIEKQLAGGAKRLSEALAADSRAVVSQEWIDVGGQLMPRERLHQLCNAIATGEIASIERLQQAFHDIRAAYDDDVWVWVRRQAATSLKLNLGELSSDRARECISQFCEQQQKFLRLVLIDAEREYDEGSRVGFGLDGDGNDADRDFAAVRGNFAENSFVKQVTAEIEALPARCEAVASQLKG
jgi:hypothetical protein